MKKQTSLFFPFIALILVLMFVSSCVSSSNASSRETTTQDDAAVIDVKGMMMKSAMEVQELFSASQMAALNEEKEKLSEMLGNAKAKAASNEQQANDYAKALFDVRYPQYVELLGDNLRFEDGTGGISRFFVPKPPYKTPEEFWEYRMQYVNAVEDIIKSEKSQVVTIMSSARSSYPISDPNIFCYFEDDGY